MDLELTIQIGTLYSKINNFFYKSVHKDCKA